MQRLLRRFLLVLMFAACLPTYAQQLSLSSNSSQPRFFVLAYHPKTSPINVPSWTLNMDDLLGNITIQNRSKKKIKSVEFSWVADSPTACMIDGVKQAPVNGKLEERHMDLDPGFAKNVQNLGLKRADVLLLAASSGRLLIDLEIIPTKVRFDDGTEWDHPIPQGIPYDSRRVQSLAENCVNQRLVPVNQLLQAKGLTSHCDPSAVAVKTVKSPPHMKLLGLDVIDDPCDTDGDCSGGGDGGGMPLQGGDGGSDGGGGGGGDTPPTNPPTPPPGFPNGWTCAATTAAQYCSPNPTANTCTVGYCAKGSACASQTCAPI